MRNLSPFLLVFLLSSCASVSKNVTTSKDLEADHNLECESVKVNIICHEDEVNNSYYLKIGILLILGLLF